jgi:hypothetical protein
MFFFKTYYLLKNNNNFAMYFFQKQMYFNIIKYKAKNTHRNTDNHLTMKEWFH